METKVGFYSDGLRIAGILYEPEAAQDRSCPGIVLCQGMVGIKEYWWLPYLGRKLADLGCVALIWDYRGIGESEGEHGRLYPLEQAEDIRNALTYLELHPKVDPGKLALAGWSFGGGMVPYVAGVDNRVACGVSVVGWSSWERLMRSGWRHWEYLHFLDRIEQDKRSRVVTGKSEVVPLGEIMPGDPATAEARERVRVNVPGMEEPKGVSYSLASVEKLLEFNPIDVVHRISPRAMLYIVAEGDNIGPPEHVVDMYNRTNQPKKLWVIPGISHYGVYEEPYLSQVFEMITGWLREHVQLK